METLNIIFLRALITILSFINNLTSIFEVIVFERFDIFNDNNKKKPKINKIDTDSRPIL